MSLINLRDISLSYGGEPLLEGVSLRIEKAERVCLVGRNGSGKSTLMRIVSGGLKPDQGLRRTAAGLRIGLLAQEIPADLTGSVYDVVISGLGTELNLLTRYHAAALKVEQAGDEAALHKLAELVEEVEIADAFSLQQRVELIMTRLELAPDVPVATLSGGLKRRVLLARALVAEPDLLLLDEPTNHLDVEAISWLEEFLLGRDQALLFITHDRALLRKLATRIVDLENGRLSSWPGDYQNYLRRKEENRHAEAVENQRFDRKLAQEEAWIRQGIKARRTRNEGRVRALEEMRRLRRQRREQPGQAEMEIGRAAKSGKLVAVCEDAAFSYPGTGRPVISGLTTTVLKGDKIGIIGPNGAGKTTLLKLLLGDLQPTAGSIRRGTSLEVVYFDQQRQKLDENLSVFDNLGDGNDTIEINGRRRHLIGYLKDFLFTPDRARSPVRTLSGGERNRLLLARLFTRPANLLIMDEPTNDLDIETLELLEELLADYQGTLLLVSHDRRFLDNVVTSTLAFGPGGRVDEFAGGYSDWLSQRPRQLPPAEPASKKSDRPRPAARNKPRSEKPRRLTFKEKQELEKLPLRLEELEKEQKQLYARLADPVFYQTSGSEVAAARSRLTALESELSQAYDRWAELEEISEQSL